MKVIIALLVILLSMPAMAEERPEDGRRRRRSRQTEARRESSADRILEQARRDIKKYDDARRKAMEKASLEMIKGLFKRAKEADKNEKWGAAYSHYHDVSSSRADGAKDMVAQSKSRMSELDGMAEERVRQARRKELYRQYPEDRPRLSLERLAGDQKQQRAAGDHLENRAQRKLGNEHDINCREKEGFGKSTRRFDRHLPLAKSAPHALSPTGPARYDGLLTDSFLAPR